MSELKEHLFCECDECIREYRGPLSNEMHPYYLKSEADKVIAHANYKRCVGIAKWCYDRWIRAYHSNKLGETRFYVRWQKHWLELAEKFKEA